MRYILGSLGGVIIIFLFVLMFVIPFTGLHYETGSGEQTGFISAVEKNGVFFKTGTAYVKTELESSQEDDYCVVNEEVFNKLKDLSKNKTQVTIEYISWFASGISNCNAEGAVIVGVK